MRTGARAPRGPSGRANPVALPTDERPGLPNLQGGARGAEPKRLKACAGRGYCTASGACFDPAQRAP